MKYYAVTEDPNELFHYGRKGMKWGKHIFGDKPKSPGYKRAVNKLKSLSSGTKKSVKKTVIMMKKNSAQMAQNRQNRQEQKFARAVANAQKRTEKINSLYALDAVKQQNKALKKQNREAQREIRAEYRQAHKDQKFVSKVQKIQRQTDRRAMLAEIRGQNNADKRYAKAEKHMDKYIQQAREGRLKYGKLTDEQVARVQERLQLEQNARRLGSTEKPRFRRQVKEAVREGMLRGITAGTASALNEIAVAKVQNRLKNKRVMDKKSRIEAKRQREANRIRNKKTKQDVREDFKQELYEVQLREGKSAFNRNRPHTTAGRAKLLQEYNAQKKNKEREQRRLESQERMQDELYKKMILKPRINADTGKKEDPKPEKIKERLNDNTLYEAVYGHPKSQSAAILAEQKRQKKQEQKDRLRGQKQQERLNARNFKYEYQKGLQEDKRKAQLERFYRKEEKRAQKDLQKEIDERVKKLPSSTMDEIYNQNTGVRYYQINSKPLSSRSNSRKKTDYKPKSYSDYLINR